MAPLAQDNYTTCDDFIILVRGLEDLDGLFPNSAELSGDNGMRLRAVELMAMGMSIETATRVIREESRLPKYFLSKYSDFERQTVKSMREAMEATKKKLKLGSRTPWNKGPATKRDRNARDDAESRIAAGRSISTTWVAESLSTITNGEWERGSSCRTTMVGSTFNVTWIDTAHPETAGMSRKDSGIGQRWQRFRHTTNHNGNIIEETKGEGEEEKEIEQSEEQSEKIEGIGMMEHGQESNDGLAPWERNRIVRQEESSQPYTSDVVAPAHYSAPTPSAKKVKSNSQRKPKPAPARVAKQSRMVAPSRPHTINLAALVEAAAARESLVSPTTLTHQAEPVSTAQKSTLEDEMHAIMRQTTDAVKSGKDVANRPKRNAQKPAKYVQ